MAKYEFILDNMIFSFSNLSLFEQCRKAWYLKYVEDREKCDNMYAQFGSFCHKILEMYCNEEIAKSRLLEYYVEYFDDEVSLLANTSQYDKYYNLGFQYFKNINLDFEDYDILGVEKEIHFEVGGHKFIGYIDVLLKDGDDIIMLDHKSSEYPYGKGGKIKKKATEKVESYKRQLYLYCKAIFEEYGIYPKKLVWNYFKDNGQFDTVIFNKDEYDATLKWAKDTIDIIYDNEEFTENKDYFYCNNLCDYRMGECEDK
jgi:hypothetical protein